MLSGLFFIAINSIGYILALWRGPFWGLLVYANIYFNAPILTVNWWAKYVPDIRWSLLSSAVLMVSIVLHRDKVSKHKFRMAYLLFSFYLLTLFITHTRANNPMDAKMYTHMLLTFCITVYLIIRSLAKVAQLRIFFLVIIGLAANLSLKAFLYGERINERLEGIGPADAAGANEFAVLLASIIPLTIPFLLRGKRYEKILCIIALPFMLNAFVLCNSRGALLAIVLAALYAFFLVANRKLKKYLLILGLCSIPVMAYLSDQYYIERISTLWETELHSEEAVNNVSTGRWYIFKHGLQMAKDHPLGVGPDGFRELARFYMPEEMLTVHPGSRYGVRAAHNSYLQVLVEQGFIGLSLYLTICFYTLYLLSRSAKTIKAIEPPDSFMNLCVLSLNISFACSLLGGMTGSRIYYEFLWWQIAFSVIIYSIIEALEKQKIEYEHAPHNALRQHNVRD